MPDHVAWRVAYAKQARADLAARDCLLQHADLPSCQQLHFLQMACEKVCKAYLCGRGTDPQVLRTSHAYISHVLPLIAREQFAQHAGHGQQARAWMLGAIRRLARQTELLSPAVDDAGRHPSNCEYPWSDSRGTVFVPAEYNFSFDMLYKRAGRHLYKVLTTAIDELTQPAK